MSTEALSIVQHDTNTLRDISPWTDHFMTISTFFLSVSLLLDSLSYTLTAMGARDDGTLTLCPQRFSFMTTLSR